MDNIDVLISLITVLGSGGLITGSLGIIQSLINRTNHTQLKTDVNYMKGGVDQAVPMLNKLIQSGQLQTGINALESVSPTIKKTIEDHSTQLNQITQVLNNALPLLAKLQEFVNNPSGKPVPEPTNTIPTT